MKNLPFASPDGDFLLADTHLYIDSPSSSLVVERASVHGARRCAERCVMDMNLYCLQVGAGDSYMGAFLVSLRQKGLLGNHHHHHHHILCCIARCTESRELPNVFEAQADRGKTHMRH